MLSFLIILKNRFHRKKQYLGIIMIQSNREVKALHRIFCFSSVIIYTPLSYVPSSASCSCGVLPRGRRWPPEARSYSQGDLQGFVLLPWKLQIKRDHQNEQQRSDTLCYTSPCPNGADSLWKISPFSLHQSASWVGCVMLCDVLAPQENIRDRLRGIPIDVSVDIQNAKRKRRQSSVPQLQPVLDTNEPATTRAEVCMRDSWCMNLLKDRFHWHAVDVPTVSV